jgi:hypothetical protein
MITNTLKDIIAYLVKELILNYSNFVISIKKNVLNYGNLH